MEDFKQIESMIDRSSLADVLSHLAQICSDKAEHIRSNWDSDPQAELWEEAAEQIEDLSSNSEV